MPTIGHIGRYALKYQLGAGGLGTVFAAHDPLLSRLIAVKTLNVEIKDERARVLQRALHQRSARRRRPQPSAHRHRVRRRHQRQPRLHRDGAAEGPRPAPAAPGGLAGDAGAGRPDRPPRRRRARLRALQGRDPSRHQAGQHLHGRPHAAARARFRHRPHHAPARERRGDERRRLAVLHVAGAGAARNRRPAHRRVLARRRPLRAADRRQAVRRRLAEERSRQAVLNHEPPLASKVDKTVPKALAEIAARAMAKDPEQRFRSARSFARDLRQWLDANPAGPEGEAMGATVPERRHPATASQARPGSPPRRWRSSPASPARRWWSQAGRRADPAAAAVPPARSRPPIRPSPAAGGAARRGDAASAPRRRRADRRPIAAARSARPPIRPVPTTRRPRKRCCWRASCRCRRCRPRRPPEPAKATPSAPGAAATARKPDTATAPPAAVLAGAPVPAKETAKERRAREAREREARERELRTGGRAPAPSPPARCRIAVSPWGQVEVDGAPSGAAPPLTELKLAEGRHQIVVRNGDFAPFVATVNVVAGQTTSIRHKFGSGSMKTALRGAAPSEAPAWRVALASAACLFLVACAQTPPAAPVGLLDVSGRPAEKALLDGLKAYDDAQYESAERLFRQALALGLASVKDRAEAHKRLAFIHCAAGRLDRARPSSGPPARRIPQLRPRPRRGRPSGLGPGLSQASCRTDRARAAPPDDGSAPCPRPTMPRRSAGRFASTGKTPTPPASSSTPTT